MRTVDTMTKHDAALSCFNFLNRKAIQRSYDAMTQLRAFAESLREPLYKEIKPLYSVIPSELLEKPLAALLLRMSDISDSVRTSQGFFAGVGHE